MEKVLSKSIVCDFASLGESVHSLLNLDVYGSINNQRKEIILFDNLVRNDVDWQAHILEGGERSIEVEVLDV